MSALAAVLAVALLGWAPQEGADLIGRKAPAWVGLTWLQGGPLDLPGLRGKLVLLRFWSAGCPYCTRSAPALEALHRRYRERGLVVVGVHHPKSPEARSPGVVREAARALGLSFAIAIDNRWRTLSAYGVGSRFRAFTSVSVLIDGEGVVRFVHDGGDLVEGAADHAALRAEIERRLPRK